MAGMRTTSLALNDDISMKMMPVTISTMHDGFSKVMYIVISNPNPNT